MDICLVCGDVGITSAFVFCVNCLECGLHRYCMEEVTSDESVPWLCEDCEVILQKQPSTKNSDTIKCTKSGCAVSKETEILSKELKSWDRLAFESERVVCEVDHTEQSPETHTENGSTSYAIKCCFLQSCKSDSDLPVGEHTSIEQSRSFKKSGTSIEQRRAASKSKTTKSTDWCEANLEDHRQYGSHANPKGMKEGRKMMFLEQKQQKKSDCDWAAGLPINIMGDVIDRLVDLSDYIRFASVCVPWRSVALHNRNHRSKKNKIDCAQIPMLMVKASNSKDEKAEFYSLTHERILNFQLPVASFSSIIGSSRGWLIYLDNTYINAKVHLFNPFSNSTVFLPPIVKSNFKINSNDLNNLHCILKASLSKDPDLCPNEFVVLLIHGEAGNLIYIQPGQAPVWRLLPTDRGGFCDVIYSKSRCLFLGVRRMGEVCSIDIDKGIHAFTPALQIREDDAFEDYNHRYIVETPGGDLLQVYRCLSSPAGFANFHTKEMRVFRFLKTECCWSESKNLGDNALFVGLGSSTCVSTSDFLGCRPCVYYSLPDKKYCMIAFRRCPDMGVADIGTKRVEKFNMRYPNDLGSIFAFTVTNPPIWVCPTYRN